MSTYSNGTSLNLLTAQFCLCPESMPHVVSGCKSYLEEGHYAWRHNSPFHSVASTLKFVRNSSLYVDLPGFFSPCIITRDQLHPGILLFVCKTTLYVIELTVGFETNLISNAERKHKKYHQLTRDLSSNFHNIKFKCSRIFGKSYEPFIDMCKEMEFNTYQTDFIVRKVCTIIIQSTYYICCMRNKPWTNPDLLLC